MRCLFGCLCVCALVVTSPLSVSAQAASEDSLSSWQVEAKPAPEEPALQLKLDAAGVEVVPSPPRTPDGYTLKEMELRVKRARIGLIVSAGVYVAAIVPWAADPNTSGDWITGFELAGFALWAGGTVGMIACGALLGVRKRKLHKQKREFRLQQAQYERPRRVQWDNARSRLVF